MSFRRPEDPYAGLLEQLSRNIQQTPVALEQGMVRQREERLIGEQRGREDTLRTEDRSLFERDRADEWSREDARLRELRRQAQTDSANNIYFDAIQSLRTSIAYLDPDSDQFRDAMSMIQQLGAGTSLQGEEAFEAALRGTVTLPDGSQVNLHTTVGSLEGVVRAVTADEAEHAGIRARTLEYLGDGAIPAQQRADYWNNVVVPNPTIFNDSVKLRALVLMGIDDPEEQRRLSLGNELTAANIRLTGVNISLGGLQVQRAIFELAQGRKFADLDYETAQAELEGIRARNEATTVGTKQTREQMRRQQTEDFFAVGMLPTLEEDRMELARRLRVDPASLEELGRERFKRVQNLEKIEDALAGLGLDRERIAKDADLLRYNRDALTGRIKDNIELSTLAFAAATTGDLSTLQVLEGLSTDERYAEGLENVDFARLRSLATEVLGDVDSARRFQADERRLLLQKLAADGTVNVLAVVEGLGANYGNSDFFPDPERGGRRGIDDDIDFDLSLISDENLRLMGVTRDELRDRLTTRAVRQRVLMDRSEAAALLDTLAQGVPESARDRASWRTQFLIQAELAEIPAGVAEAIANGLMDAARNDWAMAFLDMQLTQTDVSYRIAQARLAHAQADELGRPTGDGIILDREVFGSLTTTYTAEMNAARAMLDSSVCTLPTDQTGRASNFAGDLDVCARAAERVDQIPDQLKDLRHAFLTGSPWSLSGLISRSTTDPVMYGETVAAMRNMPGFLASDFERLPQFSRDILVEKFIETGGSPVEDLNEGIVFFANSVREAEAQAEAQVRQEQRALATLNPTSREFREKPRETRLAQLARTPEWQELIAGIRDGTVNLETGAGLSGRYTRLSGLYTASAKVDELARQFGFEYVNTIGLNIRMPADRESFRWAVQQSLAAERIEPTDVTPLDPAGGSPGGASAPAGAVGPNGEPSDDLFRALLMQESGAQHWEADGSLKLNAKGSGAMGITQIMPATALSPGYGIEPLIPAEHRSELWELYSAHRADPTDEEAKRVFHARTHEIAATIPEAEFLRFGRQYLAALLRKFDGDVELALTAYHDGPGAIARAVGQHGDGWRQALGPVAQTYAPSILALMQGRAR